MILFAICCVSVSNDSYHFLTEGPVVLTKGWDRKLGALGSKTWSGDIVMAASS